VGHDAHERRRSFCRLYYTFRVLGIHNYSGYLLLMMIICVGDTLVYACWFICASPLIGPTPSRIDFETPFVPPSAAGSAAAGAVDVSEEAIGMIESMGFSCKIACKALLATNGSLERASDWIFTRMDDLPALEAEDDVAPQAAQAEQPKAKVPSASGRYRLKVFVSHIGPSTTSGHYVAHVLKDGKWVLFNDSKVALSEEVPIDMGYLYLFEAI
jgi:uncharacterized UBP type Zn finger protein